MREDFLHFLWRWRRFDAQNLQTTDGEILEVLHPGELNQHAGPDFFNARIRLGETLWAGNVEMHLNASDWLAHNHHTDPAYDNVVLHVVLDEDQRLQRANGAALPCLELRQRIPPGLLDKYHRLMHERTWIPCARTYAEIPGLIRQNWLDRLLIERLEQKTAMVAQLVSACGQDWEEAFYRMLARNFGLKINTEPFETLAQILPRRLLARHSNNLLQLEALLFGQAGLLDENFADDYPKTLAKEYRFLRHKYDLQPMPAGQWKFFRLRPAGFPTVRLAQLAALLHRSAQLFSGVLDARDAPETGQLFHIDPSAYWQTHFRFDKTAAKRAKPLGREFVHLLLINTVAPFLFYYGQVKGRAEIQDRCLQLLEDLPPESNTVVATWAELGQKAANASDSQALLHLKSQYCDAGRCLECAIGTAILR
ncbi:MAG: DUF2851 family protein [Lewinellaceae bacterium]|nr:DUF2851 family protein [Lewinellaceae bacterium]MCB9332296.1 DUF2851 family protein [Lewinellaceae bacterium]